MTILLSMEAIRYLTKEFNQTSFGDKIAYIAMPAVGLVLFGLMAWGAVTGNLDGFALEPNLGTQAFQPANPSLNP